MILEHLNKGNSGDKTNDNYWEENEMKLQIREEELEAISIPTNITTATRVGP